MSLWDFHLPWPSLLIRVNFIFTPESFHCITYLPGLKLYHKFALRCDILSQIPLYVYVSDIKFVHSG